MALDAAPKGYALETIEGEYHAGGLALVGYRSNVLDPPSREASLQGQHLISQQH